MPTTRVSKAKYASMTPKQRAALKAALARKSNYKTTYNRTYKTKRVAPVYNSTANRSQQGMTNGFVPALSTPKFYGRVRFGASAINFTALTSQVGTYVYSANGLFDPSVTGGSLQPAGFSQLMSVYEHYTCYYSKATIMFTNNSTNPAIVGISLEPDVIASTDPNNMLELPYSQIVQLEPANTYGSTKTISLGCNVSKYFGENVLKTTSIYRGDVGNNPQEQVFFHCKCYGLKGGSADIFMNTKIEYSAMFNEARELSPTLNQKILNLVIADENEHKTHKSTTEHKEFQLSPTPNPPPETPSLMSSIFGK